MLSLSGAVERVSFLAEPYVPEISDSCVADGQLVLADNTNFPGVIETGSAMLMGFIGVGFCILCTP